MPEESLELNTLQDVVDLLDKLIAAQKQHSESTAKSV
jgi:hypothetical protein